MDKESVALEIRALDDWLGKWPSQRAVNYLQKLENLAKAHGLHDKSGRTAE